MASDKGEVLPFIGIHLFQNGGLDASDIENKRSLCANFVDRFEVRQKSIDWGAKHNEICSMSTEEHLTRRFMDPLLFLGECERFVAAADPDNFSFGKLFPARRCERAAHETHSDYRYFLEHSITFEVNNL
jgi:hypothetical protein